MNDFGIDSTFINRAESLLDSPKAKQILGMAKLAGIDVNGVKGALNELKTESSQSTSSIPQTQKNDDPLEALKRGLQHRK